MTISCQPCLCYMILPHMAVFAHCANIAGIMATSKGSAPPKNLARAMQPMTATQAGCCPLWRQCGCQAGTGEVLRWGTDLLCGKAPSNGIRSLMKGQQEGVALCSHLVPIVFAQLSPDHMIMHIYGLVHYLSILQNQQGNKIWPWPSHQFARGNNKLHETAMYG